MINEFLQYLQYEKNYSSHTVLSYHNDLIQFCDFMQQKPEDFRVDAVESTHIQQWVLLLMSEGLKAASVSRKISTLKSFWRFLLRRDYAFSNPVSGVLLPKSAKALPSFFKDNEMALALDETFLAQDFESVRNHLIVFMLYATGMRRAELLLLTDDDFDLQAGTVKVTGKRNKQRIIPVGAELSDKIKHYIDIRNKEVGSVPGHFFVRSNAKMLYPEMVYKIVQQFMLPFGSLPKKSPHVLRHTFATGILNQGADIDAVKELLGHSSLAATQVYTHSTFDELYNIYKQAHPRAK
ncbi:MAG: tyrosine-type recombinase/integrase [Paludibacter sp.]|nr:tyrosine-type recombinase/integrase [Paludibacter sp.]